MIYIVQGDRRSAIKIGFSESQGGATARLQSLQTGSPYELRILGTSEGSRENEKEIHKLLDVVRMKGEWFAWTPLTESFVTVFMEKNLSVALSWLRESIAATNNQTPHERGDGVGSAWSERGYDDFGEETATPSLRHLLSLKEYNRVAIRAFPNPCSLQWFIRMNSEHLHATGALVYIGRRQFVNMPIFDREVLALSTKPTRSSFSEELDTEGKS